MEYYRYAYLLGTLFVLFPVWLIFFLNRKDLRREMLLTSLLSAVIGPLSEKIYLTDYWHPETIGSYPFGIESLLFGFVIGGIACSVYEVICGKHFAPRRNRRHHWKFFTFPAVVILAALIIIFYKLFHLNSVLSSILACTLFAAGMIYLRFDLFWDSLLSGLFMGLLMFLAYMVFLSIFPRAIERWWNPAALSGFGLLGVPIEELLWAFAVGLVLGPAYEFFSGLKYGKV